MFHYHQAFYRISCDVDGRYKEFSLGVTSVADTIGICMSKYDSVCREIFCWLVNILLVLGGLTSVWLEPYIKRNQSHRYI